MVKQIQRCLFKGTFGENETQHGEETLEAPLRAQGAIDQFGSIDTRSVVFVAAVDSVVEISSGRRRFDIDAVNIGLMVISAVAAFAIPFELFLFSYAVLGPLHYLTEIGWLHQRAYYLRRRWHGGLLLGLGVIASAVNWGWITPLGRVGEVGYNAAALGLAAAGVLLLIGNRWLAPVALGGVYLGIRQLRHWHSYQFWLLFMVPTLIHVFAFTLAFVIHGALRSRKRLGLVSAVVLLGVAATTWLFRPNGISHAPGRYARESYAPFGGLNQVVLAHFHLVPAEILGAVDTIFSSSTGVAMMRFIAFAYTYHYLNWFSKTSVIHWHRVPRSHLMVVLVLWGISLAVYVQDYHRGLRFLFFLSFVHVLLELPLNLRTFVGIGHEVVRLRNNDGVDAVDASHRGP